MGYENVFKCFPTVIIRELNIIEDEKILTELEEIRIRLNLPIALKISDKELILNHVTSREEINYILQKICENSLYSYQSQIANGYITINGGHRVGIVGSAVVRDGQVINLNYISGLNFRISRQVKNCSDGIINYILNISLNNIYNTLIISPPGVGKTTLLRDITRRISNGEKHEKWLFSGINTTVIDERGEIGACYKGIPQNDLGIRTDIFDDMPKAIGMRMAIRSMAPKVIVADEIGSMEDVDAIKYAVCCGVKGIFTAHGSNIDDVLINPAISILIKSKIFEKVVFLKGRNKNAFVADIYGIDKEKEKYVLEN